MTLINNPRWANHVLIVFFPLSLIICFDSLVDKLLCQIKLKENRPAVVSVDTEVKI